MTFLALLLFLSGCRPKDADNQNNADLTSQEDAYVKSPLAEGQSNLLDGQVDSLVEWQSWHQDLFRQANNERRVVCALVGSGTDLEMIKVLASINQSPSLVKLLNNNHINTIIDTNLHPDIEYYMAIVSIISKMNTRMPMLVWFSYEGNLLSWTPINSATPSQLETIIQRTSDTVSTMWLESPEYTLANSQRDHDRRTKVSQPNPFDAGRGITLSLAGLISKARSLYNPVSDTVDALNKLTPARYINLMLTASSLPEQSTKQRLQCLEIAKRVANKMLLYGLIDPLDGGVYSSYRGNSQSLPTFAKTLRAQAQSMSALYKLYQMTEITQYLKAANRIKTFITQHLAQDNGDLALGMTYLCDNPQDQFEFWTWQEIEKSLTADELDLAIGAFGLSELGNISYVDDPQKIYFRKNILTWKTTPESLAKSKSISTKKLTKLIDSITSKLLAIRSQRPNDVAVEKLATSGSLALYASACISGYRATADAAHLASAEKALSHLRDHYVATNGQLQHSSYNGQLNGIPAKGADYTLVCEAALDLNEATLDPEWLQFAYKIHKQMNKNLRDSSTGFIKESSAELYPRAYPAYNFINLSFIDNDSTWALAHSNAKRLSLQINDDALDKQIIQLEGLILQNTQSSALTSIDYVTRESMARSATFYVKLPMSDTMLAMIYKQPCQIVSVTESGAYPELGIEANEMKAGSCIRFANGKRIGQASSLTQLKSLTATAP
ncbi:MAG: DUF255 domain-containing protein [Akkermansiaceae bacterium]